MLLHAHIKVIQEQVDMEKQKRKGMAQYTRAWVLDVVGTPNVTNENSKDVICKVVELAGVTNFLQNIRLMLLTMYLIERQLL